MQVLDLGRGLMISFLSSDMNEWELGTKISQ